MVIEMKKSILKGAVFGLVFFAALFIISRLINKGNTDMTTEMPKASFPVIYMNMDGVAYNELHGYARAMDTAYMRDSITVLDENRETAFTLWKFNESINSISYEVRSMDGERLIENAQILDYEEDAEKIKGQIALKDLINENEEYMLIFLVNTEAGQTARYYTRVVWSDDYAAFEKISYVIDFNSKTFDKEAAKELIPYMETNAEGDNTTFHKVDIHSSLSQVTWGDLDVRQETAPVPELAELATETAGIRLRYVVSAMESGERQYYSVEEFYRVRFVNNQMYLLDFQRNMTQFFKEKENVYAHDKIILGIAGEDIPFMESEDGNNFAFEIQNKLCSYNVTNNKLAVLFCFYDEYNKDIRTIYNNHDFKILDVDEAGNVQFVVYGYMNRGRHEGEVGIQIYYYNSMLNTVEEMVYIPYDKSYQILKTEMDELLYVSRGNYLYLTMSEKVYEVDLNTRSYENIVQMAQDGSLQVSDSHQIIAWQNGENDSFGREMAVMNLNNREQNQLLSKAGEYIMPLGFMGEDLIYGYARQEDIRQDSAGRIIFPMYKISILGVDGTILMEYSHPNVYIMGCGIEDNQITLTRSSKTENGDYVMIDNDQIMNNQEVAASQNHVGSVAVDKYEKIVQITAKKDINSKTIKILTPKEVLFEGGRELPLETETAQDRYYVYGADGIHGIFSDPAGAVDQAYDISGVVLNDDGKYIWIRGNRMLKNQIMAITGVSVTEEKDSVAICLDTMLKYEGIIRNSEYLLAQGETIYSVLENNLPDAQILDLKGCSLDAVLYYVNRDIPVLVSLNDGSAMLIVGFNQYNIVLMNPQTGTVYKKAMDESEEWLEENGNCFITYIK